MTTTTQAAAEKPERKSSQVNREQKKRRRRTNMRAYIYKWIDMENYYPHNKLANERAKWVSERASHPHSEVAISFDRSMFLSRAIAQSKNELVKKKLNNLKREARQGKAKSKPKAATTILCHKHRNSTAQLNDCVRFSVCCCCFYWWTKFFECIQWRVCAIIDSDSKNLYIICMDICVCACIFVFVSILEAKPLTSERNLRTEQKVMSAHAFWNERKSNTRGPHVLLKTKPEPKIQQQTSLKMRIQATNGRKKNRSNEPALKCVHPNDFLMLGK